MNRIIRYTELWRRLKQELSTEDMLVVLGGGKVYIEGEDYGEPEGKVGELWGRMVIVPSQTAWPDTNAPGPITQLSFIVRSEVTGNFSRPGFIPSANLEAQQVIVYSQLDGFLPTDLLYLRVAMPLFLQRVPQPLPLWDDPRQIWFTSSEWRGYVSPVD